MQLPISFVNWIMAILPVLIILFLMLGFKWSASRAGPTGWLAAFFIAQWIFKANYRVLAFSNTKGLVMALYVLYIIWGALFVYHVVNQAGGIRVISNTITELTSNRVLQIIMIGVAFPTFLQGAAGFGVPVAVSAPILAGLGFSPVISIAVPLIGHSWAVTFGDMGAAYATIQKVSGLNSVQLAPWAAVYTGTAGVFCTLFAVHCYGGFKAIRKNWQGIILISLCMSATQFLVSMWEVSLATIIPGIAGMIATAVYSRLTMVRASGQTSVKDFRPIPDIPDGVPDKSKISFNQAFSVYYSLIAIIALVEFIKPVKAFLLSLPTVMLEFGEYSTGLGWVTKPGASVAVPLFGHTGALLIYAGVTGIIVFSRARVWPKGSIGTVMKNVIKSGLGSAVATTSMVMMAFMMVESGMIFTLAKGVAGVMGIVYPVFMPLVGVLGAFITGSNINSNVMFGAFQVQIAQLLGVSSLISAAAQTAGGSIGSMIAPAKVIIATSTMGLNGSEGKVIARTLKYCIALAIILGAMAWLMLFFLAH